MKNPLFWGTAVATAILSGLFIYGNLYHDLNLELWLVIVGTVVAAVAFGFGTYFVTLAVDAYSHVAAIRQTAETVQKAASEVGKLNEELDAAKVGFIDTAKRVEQEAFVHIEAVMAAIIEYVQYLPAGNASQRKAAKKLHDGATCIRAQFTCKNSNDKTAVVSASLTLANFKDRSSIPTLMEAERRFASDKDICLALNHSIKIIEMVD